MLANGICGFALTLALLFAVQDEQAAIVAENGAVEVVRDTYYQCIILSPAEKLLIVYSLAIINTISTHLLDTSS